MENVENVKKVGFFKLGKAIKFNENSWGAIGGDCEPKQLINSIAINRQLQLPLLHCSTMLNAQSDTIND